MFLLLVHHDILSLHGYFFLFVYSASLLPICFGKLSNYLMTALFFKMVYMAKKLILLVGLMVREKLLSLVLG